MIGKYADWCRKRGRTMNCSPVLGVLAILVVAAVTVYVYREVILQTLLTALFAIAAVCAIVALGALTLSTVQWYRRRARKLAAATTAPADAEVQDTPNWPAKDAADWAMNKPSTDADEAAISEEADWLASGVELAFGPDGKLKAKGGS